MGECTNPIYTAIIIVPDFFIDNFTKEGDNVLDPFAGIGTTGVSAIQRGRGFIGFDLEKEYVDICNDRLLEEMREKEYQSNSWKSLDSITNTVEDLDKAKPFIRKDGEDEW